ncbi:hypothetical protein [Lysinibacillus sp. fls2-241-R2A-57]|uniref:hypothetical protein n=1 Tax=Lysinibacillus sp. fls2-241-R2A-57 TaxID=3040292 RepID=UPI002555CD70|nr:hypothetical protein [Lysinibacillus sp. fls2-241-R2A-57]
MFMNIEHIYFAEERNNASERKKLVCYHQTKRPAQSLQTQKTLQIMLQQDEEILVANLSKMNRYMLRRAKKEPYEVIVKENPSNQELLEFQQFYNAFAKIKNTDRVQKFHMQTLKLLREKGALVYTKLQNDKGEALCYRLYIVDEDIVFNLYTGTAVWIKDRPDLKQQIRFANRYLLWENIMMFRSKGYARYDFGAVTNKEEINEFKVGFGGQEVEVYYGYLTDSRLGKLILRLRDLKFKIIK